MSARMIIELPKGKKVFLGSRDLAQAGPGWGPFVPFMMPPVRAVAQAAIMGGTTQVSGEALQTAFESLGEVASLLQSSVGNLSERPDEVEIEFGVTLTREGNLWIAPGEGAADFKVKLAWEKD